MVITRTMIILGAAHALLRQCNIAIRYAVCRRQFLAEKGAK